MALQAPVPCRELAEGGCSPCQLPAARAGADTCINTAPAAPMRSCYNPCAYGYSRSACYYEYSLVRAKLSGSPIFWE